jgi:hypothetical protein
LLGRNDTETTSAATPVDVSNLTAVVVDGETGAITLSWTAPSDSFSKYLISSSVDLSGYPKTIANTSQTAQTVTGLTVGQSYTFTVQTINVDEVKSTGVQITVTAKDLRGTASVSGVTVSTGINDSGDITVTWTNPTDTDFDHTVVAVYNSDGTALYDAEGNAVTYTVASNYAEQTVTGLTVSHSYYFTITAVDTSGNASTSIKTAVALSRDITPPGEVTVGTNVGDKNENGDIELSWTNPTDTDFDHAVVRSYSGSTVIGQYSIKGTVGGISTATVTSLVLRTDYFIKIAAVDTSGNEGTEVLAATYNPSDKTAPAVPTNLSATNSEGTLTFTWTNPSDSDLSYETVYVYNNAGARIKTATVQATETSSYTFTGVKGNNYFFKVSATDSTGNTSSLAQTAKVFARDYTAPGTVTGISVATTADGKATLTWTNPADTDLYRIYIGISPTTDTNFSATNIYSLTASGSSSHTVTGLRNGTSYTFTLYAVDTSGNYGETVTKPVTGVDTTPPPNVASATLYLTDNTSTTATGVSLAWTGNPLTTEDFNGLDITCNQTLSGFPYTINDTANTVYKFDETTGMLASTSDYVFTIKTVDKSGNMSSGVTATYYTVKSITLNKTMAILGYNASVTNTTSITANVTPSYATHPILTWSSVNPAAATIPITPVATGSSAGLITSTGSGYSDIIVTAKNSVSASAGVTVLAATTSFNVAPDSSITTVNTDYYSENSSFKYKVAYKQYSGGSIDLIGLGSNLTTWYQSTCGHGGWHYTMNTTTPLSFTNGKYTDGTRILTVTPMIIYDGGVPYVLILETLKNISTSTLYTQKIGAYADVMVANNDRATVLVNSSFGISMYDSTTGMTFKLYCLNSSNNITPVTTYCRTYWSSASKYVYSPDGTSGNGYTDGCDSGLAYSWTIDSIAPGQTAIRYVRMTLIY